MLSETDLDELDRYLSRGADGGDKAFFCEGDLVGNWRIAGFLGRGGCGEVYRVIHVETGQVAAAKILVRDEQSAADRFKEEVAFLSANQLPQFPRFFSEGSVNGCPYLVIELLEPKDLPNTEKGIAAYLLEVCECVRALHLSGLVHRDLKPKNIMRRANGDVVLIDFGLAKDIVASSRPRSGISIVSDKPVCAGTPEYAAPEQMVGGEVSQASDIHALGRIAHAAFNGNPPRRWEAIIRRSTSSIPSQRYRTIDEFASAIRHRNRLRFVASVIALLALSGLGVLMFEGRNDLPYIQDVSERVRFNSLCENFSTNVVVNELLYQKVETNNIGIATIVERAFRTVTNRVNATRISLNHATNVFSRPVLLDSGRDYWIVGPGVLDAAIESAGSNTVVHLKNCALLNRTSKPIKEAGVRYDFQGGVYLNFTALDRPEGFSLNWFEGYDRAFNEVRFKGPETVKEVNELRNNRSQPGMEM